MTQIPLALIQEFCSTSPDRPSTHHPRLIEGKVVATDGRGLVEIDAEEIDFGGVILEQGDHGFPTLDSDYRSVLTPKIFQNAHLPMTAPIIHGELQLVMCDECWGDPLHMPTCEECKHTGQVEDHGNWHARYEHGYLAAYLVRAVQALPNVRWRQPEGAGWIVPFHFGVTGRGVIMPRRKEPTAEKIA